MRPWAVAFLWFPIPFASGHRLGDSLRITDLQAVTRMIDHEKYARLVCVPRRFKERGDVSMIDLLSEAGFLTSDTELSETGILAALHGDPSCVDDWLTLSVDNRSEGWFVRQ